MSESWGEESRSRESVGLWASRHIYRNRYIPGPDKPTGKVAFKDGSTTIGTVTLSVVVATLTRSTLAVGTHPITAEYLGDADNDKGTSDVLYQVVQ